MAIEIKWIFPLNMVIFHGKMLLHQRVVGIILPKYIWKVIKIHGSSHHQPGTVYLGCGILDYPIYSIMENKIHVPNHQPA